MPPFSNPFRSAERSDSTALAALAQYAPPADAADNDRAIVRGMAPGVRFVLLGEASHGTHEFYARRAAITRALIEAGRCDAVVIEGDWPDAWRVNCYVRGMAGDADGRAALDGFERFPSWMWRNHVVAEFVDWLRAHNTDRGAQAVGFFGMDLYSLFTSMRSVIDYLDHADPEAARRARERYSCFDHFHGDAQAYGHATAFGARPDCEEQALAQVRELIRLAGERSAKAGAGDPDAAFHATQSARLVANAEEYYRSMFRGRVSSWNQRDRHMVETIAALDAHLTRRLGRAPRICVWAHNSHLGDASATEMGDAGEWNVGQLLRERYGADACHLLGFSTFTGTVTAAAAWDRPGRAQRVNPGLAGSWEALLHAACESAGASELLLPLTACEPLAAALARPRIQRAIGVIYAPATERQSHYFEADLPRQFDALLHIDTTRALKPLAPDEGWSGEGEVPETYPEGM